MVCPSTKKGWVFPGIAGKPLSIRCGQTAISKLAEKVAIAGVSSHSFRRSALSAAHQVGLSLREVAEISGHRCLAALQRWTRSGRLPRESRSPKYFTRGVMSACWNTPDPPPPCLPMPPAHTSRPAGQSAAGRAAPRRSKGSCASFLSLSLSEYEPINVLADSCWRS